MIIFFYRIYQVIYMPSDQRNTDVIESKIPVVPEFHSLEPNHQSAQETQKAVSPT